METVKVLSNSRIKFPPSTVIVLLTCPNTIINYFLFIIYCTLTSDPDNDPLRVPSRGASPSPPALCSHVHRTQCPVEVPAPPLPPPCVPTYIVLNAGVNNIPVLLPLPRFLVLLLLHTEFLLLATKLQKERRIRYTAAMWTGATNEAISQTHMIHAHAHAHTHTHTMHNLR